MNDRQGALAGLRGAAAPGQESAARPRLARAARRLVLVLRLAALPACAQHPDEDSPEWAAREFIERMQRVHGDVQKSKAAYDLLAADARAKLEERAERASAAIGRVVKPEEMLAPSRFYLSFQPRAWSSREGPSWAIVTVEGESPRERREIRCLREHGEWKIVLDLPDLPPLATRQLSAER